MCYKPSMAGPIEFDVNENSSCGVYEQGGILRSVWLVVLSLVVIAIPIFSQAPAGAKPAFEVASIKPSDAGQRNSLIQNQPGGRLVTKGMPLRAMITLGRTVVDKTGLKGL